MTVIDLENYRARRTIKAHFIVLATDTQSPVLNSLNIGFEYSLLHCEKTEIGFSDLYLIDSELTWADPFELTKKLAPRAPTIWLSPNSRGKQRSWIKRAYNCGASDIFHSPFDSAEIEEAIRVLLRLRRFERAHLQETR